MIGNRGYAMYIRDWARSEQETEEWRGLPRRAPAGWKYLGSGCFRGAYLSPDRVVYKIQMHPGRWVGQTNIEEYRRWWNLRLSYRAPEGVRWPLVNCFQFEGGDDINAMDYVGRTLHQYNGPDRNKYVAAARSCAWNLGLSDMHHGNLAVDEVRKLLVPIDLGA